ncbi:MAG TPA: MFS transporter [Candidatus Ruania gallistercoris]|uniref:MFS transporter n=1 Tax=Candidatus Ruania gallistercoris TaxID=2838746 RepID=A0A9D2EFM1_9MICO|nr:MFS transporter [Candidatus Ruania gallistercoris]
MVDSGARGRTAGSPADPPLHRNPDYRRYWVARAAAVFGSQVTYISFPLLALTIAESPLGASFVTVITYGVPFLASLPAGALADHFSRRRIMVLADLANAAIYLALGVAIMAGSLSIELLAFAAAAVAASSAAYLSASTALLPSLVGVSKVRRAASVNDSRDFAIALVGPIVGAGLFLYRPELPFLANGGAFLLSGAVISTVRAGRGRTSQAGERLRLRTALRGLQIVGRDRSLRVALMALSLLSFVLTMNFFSVVAYFETRGETIGAGIVVAAQALGGLLGGLLAAGLSTRLNPRVVYLAQASMWLITSVTMILHQQVWTMAIVLCLTWMVTPSMRAVYQGYVAEAVVEEERGRVASAAQLATSTMSPLGVLVAGILSGDGSLAPFWTMAGVAGATIMLLLVGTSRRRDRFLEAA